MKFRKRPIVIDAERYTGQAPLLIETLEGATIAHAGDWVVTGPKGDRYPCKDPVFREIYEPVDHEPDCACGLCP